MRMRSDWMRIKLVEDVSTGPKLALPQGYERNVNDEDTFFQVMETGPLVKDVKTGCVIVCSFMSGMFRFKLPDDDFKSFAVREGDVLGIISKQHSTPKTEQGENHAGIRLS